jgi:hypothetical protein
MAGKDFFQHSENPPFNLDTGHEFTYDNLQHYLDENQLEWDSKEGKRLEELIGKMFRYVNIADKKAYKHLELICDRIVELVQKYVKENK